MRVAAVARAVDSMRAGLADPLSLADVARAGRYSPFHFHRMFREVTGLTPARFLAGLRMAEARRLLVRSPMTVADVSQRVGYDSLGTFTTQFGRLVGLSPHRFRQLMRQVRDTTVDTLLATVPAPPVTTPAERSTLTLTGEAPGPALVVARLCPTGSLGAGPGWCPVAGSIRQIRLPVPPTAGTYSGVVVVLPTQTRLSDALVDELPGSFLIGLTQVRLPLAAAGEAIPVQLRRPRVTDPPGLATAPVRWLAERWDRLSTIASKPARPHSQVIAARPVVLARGSRLATAAAGSRASNTGAVVTSTDRQ